MPPDGPRTRLSYNTTQLVVAVEVLEVATWVTPLSSQRPLCYLASTAHTNSASQAERSPNSSSSSLISIGFYEMPPTAKVLLTQEQPTSNTITVPLLIGRTGLRSEE